MTSTTTREPDSAPVDGLPSDGLRKHRQGWRMSHLHGGTIRWTSPLGRTYVTEPSTVMRA